MAMLVAGIMKTLAALGGSIIATLCIMREFLRRSSRRKGSGNKGVKLRDLFSETRPVTPTELAVDEAVAEAIEENNDTENKDLMSVLNDTISWRPRKDHVPTTPLFDYLLQGNKSMDSGWLRKEVFGTIETECKRPQIPVKEKRLLTFLLFCLSGVSDQKDGHTPGALLSVAWGFSKPAILRAGSWSLEQDFVAWITADGDNETDGDKGKKRNKSMDAGPSNQVFQSPTAGPGKRRDLKSTPALLVETKIASPSSTSSPASATCSPISASEEEDGFVCFSPERESTNTNGKRLDFGQHEDGPSSVDALVQADKNLHIDTSTQTIQQTIDAVAQTDTKPLVDASTQTDFHSRLQADISEDNVSRQCESDICRALFLLFKQNRPLAAASNPDRVSTLAATEILTLRQLSGSSLKIMRIKSTRNGTKGDSKGRKTKTKALLVETLVSNLGLSENETVAVLKHFAVRRNLQVLKQSECSFTIDQCAALMLYLPVTARGLERSQKFAKVALPKLGNALYPTRLRKKLATYSIDSFNLKLGFELVSLEIGGEKRNQRCLHVWIREPAAAVEALAQSALISGRFECSSQFSNHTNALIVTQGSDRGGDITSNMIRVANRAGGNSSQHCLPLSFYEFGKESYNNLQQTIFNEYKPTKKFLQSLLYGSYHMIVVTVNSTDGSTVLDAQCVILQINSGMQQNSPQNYTVKRNHADDSLFVLPESEERELPPVIDLMQRDEATQALGSSIDPKEISIQLGVSRVSNDNEDDNDNDDDDNNNNNNNNNKAVQYKGFTLRNCLGRVVHRARFSEPLVSNSPNNQVDSNCLACVCMSSDDIKCNVTLMGQGTASSMCPCTICTAAKKDFASYTTKNRDQQAPYRAGQYANPTLYDAFVDESGGRLEWVRLNSTGFAKKMKSKYKSVVHEPLLYTPPNLNSGSIMHVSSGLLTHCTVKMLEKLAVVDGRTPWLDDLSAHVEDAKQFIRSSHSKADVLRKEDAKKVRDLKAAEQSGFGEAVIQSYVDERHQLSLELAALTKAIVAAKLFVEKGSDFLNAVGKKTKLRIVGPATYAFRKAYEVDGRVPFRVENSGFELSNGDGIRVLERRQKIVERMGKIFGDQQLQSHVDGLMEVYLELTRLLYDISIKMKSQKRWSMDDCDAFEAKTRLYAQKWIDFTGGSEDVNEGNVFNKLHVLTTHTTLFARQHGLLGRVSEEGFESSHKSIESVRKPLACMTSTSDRAHTIYRRILLQSRPEVESIFRSIDEAFTKKKRGPYRKDPTKMKTADSAPAGNNIDQRQLLPQGFVHSINGYVVKEKWRDAFEYVCFSKVPNSWCGVFVDDCTLGEACRLKAEYA
ncbi:unknown protein [Seminavis robusta]|uniref:Uncharacterized protein n=1 Tax=Seminavis robusta TaxID=568900 RepID=A0A9N8F3I9_9STRA|nr:unknown protein [Seminavis robusta]|eukprot:Sro3460_g348260.1 n/a (1340) ;mRNA; r:477-4496